MKTIKKMGARHYFIQAIFITVMTLVILLLSGGYKNDWAPGLETLFRFLLAFAWFAFFLSVYEAIRALITGNWDNSRRRSKYTVSSILFIAYALWRVANDGQWGPIILTASAGFLGMLILAILVAVWTKWPSTRPDE
ncbi:hypothetical protein ACFL6E_01020 [Candidatus Neomarinimicrobiota bacterium]